MRIIMKKLMVLLLLALLLAGCAQKADDPVEAVREQINSLPTVEEFKLLSPEEQTERYNRTQRAYEAYRALTEKQRQELPEAGAIFEALFSWFNVQVQPLTVETEPETAPPTTLPDVVILSEEDQELLLKLAMAERGSTGCKECMALVICTVRNRVESDRFADTVRGVIYSVDQFTPVSDGSFAKAEPDENCREALQMVIKGWDESRGSLFYEWCEGESWHSKNLELLLQHCDTRFYR